MDTYPLNAKVAFETEHLGVSHRTSRLYEPEGRRLTGSIQSCIDFGGVRRSGPLVDQLDSTGEIKSAIRSNP